MATSILTEIKVKINKKARKSATVFLFSILFLGSLMAQPAWVPTTPSVASTGPLSITMNYGINMVGTVYIIVINYDTFAPLTSGDVRLAALAGPGGSRVATAVLNVNAGNINNVLQVTLDVINANTIHTIYIVAEGTPGGLQATPIRLNATTLPCPKIQLFTFFGNLGECVNLGAQGMFQVAPLGLLPTGILKGSTWSIDWGDGSPIWTYTSTADNDLPGIQTHLYTSNVGCTYQGTWTVKNPCNEFLAGSSIFVVHGRDIPADGDGLLRMEETSTHTPDIIYLCEGVSHTITVTDISKWNCQTPVVPFPLNPADYDNDKPRTLQFVYGETPAGAVMNTITGNVIIGGVNIANAADGYVGPVITPVNPPNPNTVSQTIMIPATSVVGQRFYVYLKNWNKCNPYLGNPNADYEYEDFIIEIIDAPPAPIVVTPQNYCFGSVPLTISATPNLPGNTIKWYADAGLTTLLYTGINYTHGKTAAGTYNFWVTETSTGNGCEGPAAQITMNIYAVITNNTVAAVQTICYNTVPAGLTGTAPAGGTGIYGYQWQSSADNVTFNNIVGATAANYSPGALTSTTWYRRIVNSGPCSNISGSIQITVYANLTAGTIQSAQSICYNTAPAALAQATAPTGGTGAYTYQWQDSPDNVTFTNIGGATASSYSPPALTANSYYRRNVTSGSCGTVSSASILITVYANLTAGTVGSAQTICYNAIPAAFTQLTAPAGGTGAYTYQWQSSPDNSVWTSIGGATGVGYTSVALTANTYFRRQVTSGSCGTVSSPSFLITVYANLTAGTIGSDQSICYNTAPAALTQLTAPTGGTGAYTYQWQDSPDNVTFTNIGGATAAGYAPPVLIATRYYRRNVTSGTCGTVSSASVTITVNGILTAGTIGTAQSICYNTAPAALTQLTAPTGGTGAYTYQWQDSPDNVTFTNIGGATGIGYAPPALTANKYYRRNITSGSCGTVSSASVLITVYANLTAGTIGSAQTICYNSIPAALTQLTAPTGGPGAYTYQWQSSPDNATWTSIGGATAVGYAPPALTVNTYYRRNVTSGSCGTVSSTSILISINPLPAPVISGETQPCLNNTKTYSTPLVGGHTYSWTVTNGTISGSSTNNTVNIQWNIVVGLGTVRVTETITATGCLLQTPAYNVTVNPAAPGAAGAITGPVNVCDGQSGVNYSITAVANASNYVWTVPAGVTIVSGQGTIAVVVDFALGAASPRTISVYPENGCGAGAASNINVNIYNQLTAGTIGTAQSICYNTIPAALTQLTAPTGGPGGYTYQWQSSPDNSTWTSIGGATAVGYTPPALTASTYYRRQVTSGTCGTVNSASILITVYGNLTAGTIGTAQTICYNTIPAPLTELTAPTGGPGGYTYQWQDSPDNITFTNIGGATAIGYTPPALTASRYYRRQVTSGTCGTVASASVTITVYGNLTAGTIGTAQSLCYNTAPAALTQLSAPTGGIGVYTFQWQDSPDNVTFNNIAGATTVGYTPPVLTATTYYRRNVTSGTCGTVSSASVTITVYGNFTAGTIGTAQSICYNAVPAALTQLTVPAGGTGVYTYQWQSSPDNSTWTSIGGATAVGYAPPALTVNTYYRRQVTSGSCGTVNNASILITVYGNLTAGTIGTAQTICYNTAPAALTELTAPTGGPGGYTYQWQSSPDNATWTSIGGATAVGYAPAALTASTYYRRQVTSGTCGTVNSASILITVYGNLTAGTIGTAQSICYNTIPAALTQLTAPSGGTGAYTYQWQSSPDNAAWTSIGGATAAGYAPPALSSSTYYRRQVTSGTCGTVNSASILITVYGNLTSGTIGSNQSVCYNTVPAALTELTAPTGGPGGYTYQWQSSPDNSIWNNIGGATAVGYAPPALTTSTYYRRQVTSGTCGTVSSASILVTVYGNLTPGTIGSNQSICYNTAPAAFTNTASPTGGTGLTYQWQNSPAGLGTWVNIPGATALTFTESALLIAGTDYRRVTTSASGCGTVNSNIITVTVKQLPAITAGQNPSTCSGIAINYQILLNNFVNPGDNVTFTWPAPVHSAGVAGGIARAVGTSANITDTYTNTSGGVGTVTYAVTPVKDGCTGPTVNVVVSVGSEPVLDPGLNRSVCSNAATGLILKEAAGSVVPTHYNIISESIAPGLVADASNAVVPNAISPANYLSADKFANLTGVDKTVTYRVQPVLAPNCFGTPVDVIITIRPQPVVQPGQTNSVCSGVAIGTEIKLLPANTPAGTLFNWGLPVMSDASVQGTAGVNVAADPAGTKHINDQINNYLSAPITATYTITPVSQFGCAGNPVPVVITINQEPVPQPISGKVNLCVGDKNIVYNVNPVGGSSFHWTVAPAVGSITFDFNTNAILIDAALAAGSGNITVYETNSLGCSGDISTLPVQVYAQPAPENIIGDAVVCALSTHTYNVTNRAGSVYNWTVPGGAAIIGDPSASSISIIFGNVGGTILVRETNIAGCITNHNPFAVTVNPLPTAIISNGGNMCDGGTRPLNVAFTGTASFNFTYAINGVSQTPISTSSNPYTINATLAGTYTIVNITDNTGCTNTGSGSTTITYFPKPTGIISGGGELCRGSSATLTISLTGVAPFTFTYTDGTTPVTVTGHPNNVYTASVSPLVNSTYTLTSLTDFNNCVGVLSGSAVINVNQPPSLSLTGTNLICYNVPTGAVDMTISSGTAPFGIAWTGPNGFTSPVEDISGLNEGYYAVTVTDSKGCKATANITLTQPPVLNGTVASTNITCFGANDGTITISGATGGTGTYEYTINGGTTWAGSGTFTGLAPNTYNVKIRDLVNPTCILVLNNSLVLTSPAVLSATVTKTDITCFGANNGSIIISSPTGGYGTYQYTINGGTTWIGSGNFTNLIPGTYNVQIRDAINTGCVIVLNPVLVVTAPPVLSATVNRTNITCFGSSDGTITISAAAGGHGTYEYSINGGGSWQVTGNYTGLTPGTYNVQIRDAAFTSCYIVLNNSLILTQPSVLTATLASTNVTCNGTNDGTISITGASGGYGTYEYTINGGTTWVASGLFTNVAPGTYDVRIRDAVNTACVIILNAGLQITEPAVLMATVMDTDISCFGANNGVITITNSAGGYGTFQYSINGGSTWQDSPVFSSLSAGSYDVRIRDKAHITCVVTLNPAILITEPAALSATATGTNVTCNGANDGTITISGAAGGYGSYQYSINGGASWQGSGNFTGLAPGSYNVRMRDALNPACTLVLNPALGITEPVILSATVTRTNVTCFGAADGTITISGAAGGYGTYEYTIDGGATWQASGSFAALNPGFYNIKIRDAAHITCVITLNASLQITEPAVLSANVARTNVTCNGSNDGTITITNPLGGYGTYEYSINGGGAWQASGTFTSLAPATYNVQIRDAAHATCVITLNGALVITEPLALGATITPTMISCFGANNGIIAITNPTGGYGTYEYTVNGGTTWSSLGNFTNLAPGTYDVRMRDAAHITCALVLNPALIITQPAVLNAVIASTNVTCFGGSDGTITITNPTGGYGTYEYTVNGGGAWQASGSFTGLGPGTYNVQIRDAAHPGCVIVLNNTLVITQPAILRATLIPTMVTCFGANDGIITITNPLGGFGTYEYSNNGGTTWQASGTFSGLAPANYDVRIRDAAHTLCEIALNPGVAITEPAVLNAVVASVNISCTGSNSGIITISSPAGGYGTYEYTINGGTTWQVSGTFSSLAPGFYDVRIRDRAHIGCVIVLNPALEITETATLTATVASTDVTCNGSNDGTITISNPAGGTGTYGYTVNGGASWQNSGTFTNVAPGTYNVRIRDAASTTCEVVLNPALVISQPAKLAAAVASTNVNCFGANDGTITITAPTGGYGTYEYSIDGGTIWQAGGNFSALAPGFYNVQIRDAAHITCVVTLNGSLRITEPSVLSANVTSINVTCNGANDGRITVSGATGGYGTYEYSISGGASWQASGTFTSLAPGSFNVQIRDAAHTGCIIVLNPALIITEPAVLTATLASVNITCFGANNGIITITGAAGGYGTYEYSINGGTNWSGLNNFTNLAPGSYDVRIRDAAHATCTVTLNPALLITQPAVLHADIARTNVTCFGGSDGTITITNPTGGYGTYEYSINGGGSWQASGIFTGLGPGNYNVITRDAAHITCVITLDNALQITQPSILNAIVTPTMVTCNGANDGIITIANPTGGYGTYEYSINGGTSWQVSGTFNVLAPGTYDVRIRDAVNTGCTTTLNPSVMITEPSVLNAIVTSVNVTCFGANNGIITISSPTGGYGTYEYSVNGGGTWQSSGTFSSLTPGTYDVRIRDKAHTGCVIVLNPALVITQPAVLSATVTPTMITCNGANDGIITITNPLGGYGSYAYTINGGATWQTSGTFNYLAPGTYNVRIRDAANITCEIVLNPALVITQPLKLAATVANTAITCYGANDGAITITAPTGGYGTYEYSIDGGANWQAGDSFTALAPGFYNVQIRDAAHPLCIVILNGSLRISEPPVLTSNVSRANVTCNGANDGTITITSPMGGYGTYQYSITGGTSWQATGSFTGLAPGSYNVQIRDAVQTACVIVLNPALVITEPAILTATVTSVNVGCFGSNDGSISISAPAGGYGTYQYSVNGGTTWQGFGNFTNLAPGSYDVRIRDAANIACIVTLNPALVITQPAVLAANVASTNVTCFGGNDGTITISGATGGYGTYEYSINGGGSWQAPGTFNNLAPGTYNVMIRDAAHTGCIIVLNNAYIMTQPAMLSATIAKTDVSCNGDNDGTISITSPAGGYGTYEYTINGGTSWQASGNYTSLAPGSYDIRIRDAAHTACSAILYPNLLITEPITLSISSTGNVLLDCFGDMDGMGTFFASGGTMPYTFLVVSNTTGGTIAAPGFNSQTFFNAGAGSITVSVVDFNGCSAQATINITQPAVLNPGAIAADQVVCYGDNPAILTETSAPNGGPAAYIYQWQSSTNVGGPFVNIAGATLNQYTPPAGATYTLYYRRMVTSGTCMPVYSNVVQILVNARPVAFLTGGETICPGLSSVIRVNMLAGTGPFTVEIANHGIINNYVSGADIVVTPAVTTTYSLIRVRDANNCEVVAPSPNLNGTATVIVSDLPVITSFTPSPAVCEFTLANFKVTATGTNLTYQWFVNQGSGFNAVVDGGTYFGAMTPTLQIFNTVRTMNGYVYHVVVSGCGTNVTSADATFTVNTAPEITLHPKDSTICLGQNAVMDADATGTNVTWKWYVNKGSGFVLSVDDANFSGSATRTLTITNAQASFNNWVFRAVATGVCGVPVNTNFAVLRVVNPPAVTLQPVARTICENGSTSFLGNGTGYTSLQWQVFSGGVWTNLTDNATYIGTNTQQLAIINAPVAFNSNQYRLALITGCATTYSNAATLTVNGNPVVDFSAVDPISACGGVPIVINGNPTSGSGIYTQHRWTGDVGPLNSYTVQSPTFNSLITGTYNLNYRVTDSNGCTSNDDVAVTVDSPSAQFTQNVDFGCTPLPVTFTKDMTGLAKWWWNFGDGSPLDSLNANPDHTFVNNVAGSIEYYNVKLKVRSAGGCFAEFTSTVTVYPAVDATFTPNLTVICSGNPIIFTALSGASRYFWEYGDGASGYATNVTNHLYTNLTTAPVVNTVKLTTTSFYNCVDVKTFDITVMPVPIPQFTAVPLTQVFNAAGNPVTFTNTTNPGTWNWFWKFGDNATSTVENPVHSYTNVGTFAVTLVASNANCSDSVKHSVSIVPPAPVANFDSIPSGCSPLFVNINNTSLNTSVPGTTYQWDFGDGSHSTAKNPTYTYFTAGTYRIELVVTGPGGTSMKTQVVNAYASPKAYFEVTPPMVYVNDERVRCFNLSQGATSYLWDFGDGDTSKLKEPYHRYMEEGVFDITLWAYSANGCSDQYKLSPAVTVEPVGELRFSTVFTPNKTGPIERTDLPTGGTDVDQFFFPPIRQKVLKYKLQIFNRLGVLIFQSNDINVPWNGYYKGKLCQQGVYVWYVEGKYADGKPFKQVGNVTLLQ